jgi:Tfp pilus assembly protein PilP
MTRLSLVLAILVAAAVPAAAQAPAARPAAQPQAAAPPPAPPTAPAAPTPPANYVYATDGRRDPFVALLGSTGRKGDAPAVRAEGVPGILTDEVSVKGILQSQGAWVAMIAGPAGKVYTVRAGDRLADGTIRSITPQFLVIMQQVNDPLSLEKQREVRKFLRGGDNK